MEKSNKDKIGEDEVFYTKCNNLLTISPVTIFKEKQKPIFSSDSEEESETCSSSSCDLSASSLSSNELASNSCENITNINDELFTSSGSWNEKSFCMAKPNIRTVENKDKIFFFPNENSESAVYQNLLKKKRKNVSRQFNLGIRDIQRLAKSIKCDIFGNECCLWNSPSKKKYVTFYLKGKKMALHRILYGNYCDSIGKNEYIKYTCGNKGMCCTLSHMQKCKYKKK